MSVLGTADASLDIFGGLVTEMAAPGLPPGVSPDCADVAFLPGAVQTRPGLASVFSPIAGNPTVNYLKTYTLPDLSQTLLALDSAGSLWGAPSATLGLIASGIASGARAKSVTMFGREYIAFHDGKFGVDMPRQYDGAFFDRVSQVGPGSGPLAASDAPAEPGKSISSAARASGVVTITTSVNHNYLAGETVVIAGVADGSFNGTFVITSITGATTFTYLQSGADASSSGGTVTLAPQISAGVHQVCVFFKTRQGYFTQPSPPVSWNAQGGRRVSITGIPVPSGDTNVVARILAFTAAGGTSFFYTSGTNNTPNMVIANTTQTSVTLDFSDATLLAGTNVDYLFRLVELGECAGVIGYASRLFWWGERNKLNNFANLSFDGGWSGNTPLGWTLDPALGAGCQRGFSGLWGARLEITADGTSSVRGLITQSAAADTYGVPRLAPNTRYSVRARVMALPGLALTQGTLTIHLFSQSAGINTTGLQVTAAQVNALPANTWGEFTAVLTDPLASIPSDLVLRVLAANTPAPLAAGFAVDNIEIFPTAQPYNATIVRASRAGDPESYDGINGLLAVSENDGQAVRSAFTLRGQLYFVKEHSIHSVQDDGVNEPAAWTITEVSRCVGTPSADGVDVGEDWAAIAHRSGLYVFAGGEPVKVSQEIQPLWDQINWSAGHTLWVRVDTRAKRILVGAPFGAATQPSRILVLDYRGLQTAEEIASMAAVNSSAATGRALGGSRARKWAPWNISANCAALAERSDGTAHFFLGNGAANGKIYELSDSQHSDDGAPIASYYTTAFLPGVDGEAALGAGGHRKLFCYLTAYCEGAGNLSLTAFPANQSFPVPLAAAGIALSSPAARDLELPINVPGERVAFQLGTSAAGSWFRLSRLTACLKPDPWSPVRGF